MPDDDSKFRSPGWVEPPYGPRPILPGVPGKPIIKPPPPPGDGWVEYKPPTPELPKSPWQRYGMNEQGGMSDFGLYMMKQGMNQEHPFWQDPEQVMGQWNRFRQTNPMGGGFGLPGLKSTVSENAYSPGTSFLNTVRALNGTNNNWNS